MALGWHGRRLWAAALPLLLFAVESANPKKQGKLGGESLEGLLKPSDIPDSPHSKGFEPRSPSSDRFSFGRAHAALEHILEKVPAGDIQQVPRELQAFSSSFKLKLVSALSDQVIEQALTDASAAAGLQMYPSPQKKYLARWRADKEAVKTEFPENTRGVRMLVLGSSMGTYELRTLPLFLRIPIPPYAFHEVVSVEPEAHLSSTGSQLIFHAVGNEHTDIVRHLPLVPSDRTPLSETLESLQETYELPDFDLVVLSGGSRDKQSDELQALMKTGLLHNGTVVSAHGPGSDHDATGRYLMGLGNRSFNNQVHELEDGSAAILSIYRPRSRDEL